MRAESRAGVSARCVASRRQTRVRQLVLWKSGPDHVGRQINDAFQTAGNGCRGPDGRCPGGPGGGLAEVGVSGRTKPRRSKRTWSCFRSSSSRPALLGDRFHDVAEPIPGPSTMAIGEKARQHGMYIVAGIAERGDTGVVYNTAVIVRGTASWWAPIASNTSFR